MSATEAELRAALRKMHARACGNEGAVYMSIPADPRRDADLLLDAAIDELVALRGLRDELLAALVRLKRDGCNCAVNEPHQGECDACGQARAVIARATGGEP